MSATPPPQPLARSSAILPKASGRLLTGILLTVFAGVVFAMMDTFGKTMTALIPVIQIVWARYFVQTVIVGTYLWRTTGSRFLRTRRPVLQVVRGMMLLATSVMMYTAVSHVPLADATSAFYFTPMIVTLLSVLFLGERIGLHRISAIVAGFCGVLLIVQPGSSGTSPYLLLPLGAAFMNSIYLLMTRRFATPEDTASTQFNTTAVGAAIFSGLVIPVWQTPSPATAAMMVAIGVLGTIGHTTLVRAFAHAPASLLSPYLYSQVVAATLVSVLWFGDAPRPSMLVGTAILMLSGLYIWWRENRS